MTQDETNKRSVVKTNDWETRFELSDYALEDYRKCIGELVRPDAYGLLFGTLTGSCLTYMIKPFKMVTLIFPIFGGLYGTLITHYFGSRDCFIHALQSEKNLSKFVATPREHNSSQLEEPFELKRGSQMDIETFQQIGQHEDFPSINAAEYQPSANVDGPEKKMSKGITYDELRQKNRDSYRPGQIKLIRQRVQRPVDSSENQSSQSQDIKSGFNEESDLFPLRNSTGKNKTKYGDIWD